MAASLDPGEDADRYIWIAQATPKLRALSGECGIKRGGQSSLRLPLDGPTWQWYRLCDANLPQPATVGARAYLDDVSCRGYRPRNVGRTWSKLLPEAQADDSDGYTASSSLLARRSRFWTCTGAGGAVPCRAGLPTNIRVRGTSL